MRVLCRVMIQIILLLTHMQLKTSSLHDPEPQATAKDDSRKIKKKRLKKPPKSSSSSMPSSPASDPIAALDLLTDRLTVWQAIGGTEVAVYSEKDVRGWINGKKILVGEGDGEEDWVKRFWRVVVWPLFGSHRRNLIVDGAGDGDRSADVEKFVRGMHRKVFGADVAMEEDDAPKTSGMEVEPVVAVAPKRTMKREPSVIAINPPGLGTSNTAPSTFIRSASVQAMQMGTGNSRRSSMESNSSVRMLSTSIKDPSRAGSMGPPAPAPGRRVSGNGNAPDSLDLDESDLDSLGRIGSLRRSTSRVNSGMNLFKGREVGFSRSNSFKPIESSGSNSQAGNSSGQNGSGSGSGSGILAGGVPLGRTSSAMAGMNVILGKRKTMIVPKDKTSSGSFIKPTDPANRTAGLGSGSGLQKSFSTSTLAMATPSKPRYESRLTTESQPIPMAAAPPMSAFVAETPSNASVRRQTADNRFSTNKASWESTKQVLFPAATGSQGDGGNSLKGEDQHGLADFMEDTDDEDDGASFFTSGKRRRLDSNAKDNLRHVVLFRNPAGDTKQDQYTLLLTATKRFRPKSLSVLGQTFVNQHELAEVIRSESDKWSGLIATSKRAGEAWCAACKIVKQEGHGGDPDWSHVPLYTPGPATGASFVAPDLTSSFIPRRIDAAEETGSAIPLGNFIVHHHRTLSQNPTQPLLILEGDKNGPNLIETLGDAVVYTQRETYATGPREDLALDLLHLCQTLAADSSWNRPTWLVFFAPSSAKAVLDCLELTEFASGLPLAGAPRVESMLRFRLASVGNTTAAYLSDRGLEVEAVAKQPTAEGVRDALQEAD
jgi:uroporphyrinogen-III synthase